MYCDVDWLLFRHFQVVYKAGRWHLGISILKHTIFITYLKIVGYHTENLTPCTSRTCQHTHQNTTMAPTKTAGGQEPSDKFLKHQAQGSCRNLVPYLPEAKAD